MTDYFHLNVGPDRLQAISSLGLAHLGDAVFELMVRARLCLEGKDTSRGLHHAAVAQVSATAQAAAIRKILPALSGEEQAVFRRGRNAKPHTIPQTASREDYMAATGLETLFGWLYLRGETARLNELFDAMMEEGDGHAS